MNVILEWASAHELVVWFVASFIVLPFLRTKTPEQWVELADSNPRLHGIITMARAIGVDPVRLIRGLKSAITGQVRQRGGTKLPLPPTLPLFLLMVCVSVSSACAHWDDKARYTLEAAAVATNMADQSVAGAIEYNCGYVQHIHQGPERDAALAECISHHRFDTAITAINATDHALRVAQSNVDAAVQADDEGVWTGAIPCTLDALENLIKTLRAVGVAVPQEAESAIGVLTLIMGAGGSTCTGGAQ